MRRCITIKKILTIWMEVYAEERGISNNLHSENQGFYTKKKKMKELNVSLVEAMNYIVQLFYKTEQKYSCTRTKIGKLLSIAAFKFAAKGELLFNEIIYKYPPACGTLIKDLEFLVCKNIYIRELNKLNLDNPTEINPCEIKNGISVPLEYNKIETLSDTVRDEIKNVFLCFGAYSGDSIGKLLNLIVDKIVVGESNELNLVKLSTMCKNDFLEKDNVIVNYVYKE